mgnify:FL=1
MKRRTYALLLALALSASLLTSCAGGSGSDSSSSQSNGGVSSSQTEDQSEPDASTPDTSLPDGSTSQQPAPDGSTSQEAPGDAVTDEPQAEASLSLDTNDFTLFSAGSSHTLKATVQPSGQKVTFTSGNEKVATVDQNGKVTAVAPGTAKITVTAGDLTATCIVRCRWEDSKPSNGGSSSSGGNSGSSSTPETPETPAPAQVDLSAFYTTESGKYEFGMVTLADAELAANVYPGLFDIAAEQCLPYINMMTMNTSEIVLVQVTNSSDVDKVKSILQSRIDAQVEGGAWYPSAIDAWQNNSRIVSNGNYIMMVVHESCDSIVSDFNALF